jgi:hypothetical protein
MRSRSVPRHLPVSLIIFVNTQNVVALLCSFGRGLLPTLIAPNFLPLVPPPPQNVMTFNFLSHFLFLCYDIIHFPESGQVSSASTFRERNEQQLLLQFGSWRVLPSAIEEQEEVLHCQSEVFFGLLCVPQGCQWRSKMKKQWGGGSEHL